MKGKYKVIMQVDYMSSEHSMSDMDADLGGHGESGSDSDLEIDRAVQPRKFAVNSLNWRSEEVDKVFTSLDKRTSRKRRAQGKRMLFERCKGVVSSRTAPLDAPAWVVKEA